MSSPAREIEIHSGERHPYSDCRESGLAWFADIPAHWRVSRLKRLVSRIGSGKTPRGGASVYSETGVIFLRSQNIHFEGLRLDDVAYIDGETDQEMAATRVFPGDVLLNITGASLGRCAMAPAGLGHANVNQHVCVVRPNPAALDSRFLLYLLSSYCLQAQIFSSEDGISREGLTFAHVGDLLLAYPHNLAEQAAIASFLDQSTARIDSAISKSEQLLGLIEERRAALINRAMTKGLDPRTSMNDSGIPWLGSIPSHWQVVSVRHCCTALEQGWSPVADDRAADEDCWAVVKLSAVNKGSFRPAEHKALPAALIPEFRFEIRRGDFLLTRSNTPDLVGDVCLVKDVRPRLMLCDLVYRITLRSETVRPEYMLHWLLSPSGRYQIVRDARGSSGSMVKIAQGHILAWKVPLPPLPEQAAIAAFIETATARLDAIISKTREQIAKFHEYRTALISAAVTGKIDVRSASEQQQPLAQEGP
jgi:type I restriction enzyme S subunit